MSTATIRYDRSAILKDAWCRARQAAAEAAERVRRFISGAMRAAWAEAKAALVASARELVPKPAVPIQLCLIEFIAGLPPVETPPAPPAAPQPSSARQRILDRLEANEGVLARLRHDIERDLAVNSGGGYIDDEYRRLDDLHAHGSALGDELRDLEAAEAAAAPAPAAAPAAPRRFEQGAFATVAVPHGANGEDYVTVTLTDADGTMRTLGAVTIYSEDYDGPAGVLAEALRVIGHAEDAAAQPPADVPAQAPEPDLSTVEGLREVLVGRTANLRLQGGEALYTVVGVSRWTSPDGALVRDYVKLETSGFLADDRKGPLKLHIVRRGARRGPQWQTKAGFAVWDYGRFCDSSTKRENADDVVREILAPIAC